MQSLIFEQKSCLFLVKFQLKGDQVLAVESMFVNQDIFVVLLTVYDKS